MNIKGIDLLTQFLNPLADSAQSLLFAEDIRQLHCAAGRGLLTGKGCSDGPEQLTVFDAQLADQCHQAVMDGSFIPVLLFYLVWQKRLSGGQCDFIVGFHFLMGIQLCAVIGQLLEEIHQTGDIVEGFQTLLEQCRDFFEV